MSGESHANEDETQVASSEQQQHEDMKHFAEMVSVLLTNLVRIELYPFFEPPQQRSFEFYFSVTKLDNSNHRFKNITANKDSNNVK